MDSEVPAVCISDDIFRCFGRLYFVHNLTTECTICVSGSFPAVYFSAVSCVGQSWSGWVGFKYSKAKVGQLNAEVRVQTDAGGHL